MEDFFFMIQSKYMMIRIDADCIIYVSGIIDEANVYLMLSTHKYCHCMHNIFYFQLTVVLKSVNTVISLGYFNRSYRYSKFNFIKW